MATATVQRTRLGRELGVWGPIGVSVALIAPSMAANIDPQATAAIVGRALAPAEGLA